MISKNKKIEKKNKNKKTKMSLSSMPPPPAPQRKRAPERIILEEDDYLDRLDAVIQRQFFPDLYKLKKAKRKLSKKRKRESDQMVESSSTPTLKSKSNEEEKEEQQNTELVEGIKNENEKQKSNPFAPSPPSKLTALEKGLESLGRNTGERNNCSSDDESSGGSSSSDDEDFFRTRMTLKEFHRKFTSEDNASFSELAKKDKVEHENKYWWAFEKNQLEAKRLRKDRGLLDYHDAQKFLEGPDGLDPDQDDSHFYDSRPVQKNDYQEGPKKNAVYFQPTLEV